MALFSYKGTKSVPLPAPLQSPIYFFSVGFFYPFSALVKALAGVG